MEISDEFRPRRSLLRRVQPNRALLSGKHIETSVLTCEVMIYFSPIHDQWLIELASRDRLIATGKYGLTSAEQRDDVVGLAALLSGAALRNGPRIASKDGWTLDRPWPFEGAERTTVRVCSDEIPSIRLAPKIVLDVSLHWGTDDVPLQWPSRTLDMRDL